jgi:hypothetical protein
MTNTIPETQLDEMTLSEEKVLEKLNAVSTAKRLANMVSAIKMLPNISDSWPNS